tara:strand:+ start:856 stop:1062 length:207 start_codon:yes stop_codon:yes gene_type:complete
MGMSSYIMDCEEQFANSVSLRIGGCESVSELVNSLTKDNCFADIAHIDAREQLELVDELWGEFWSDYA